MSDVGPKDVIEAVEDRFFDYTEFSSVGDIAAMLETSKTTVRGIVQDLEGTALHPVYSGDGKPTVYVTESIFNQLSDAFVDKYDWITEFEFDEKKELKQQKEKIDSQLREYHSLEKLLYASGNQLEDAICEALDTLNIDYTTTEEDEDIRIEHDDALFIIEIKGKSGSANKSDINQLGGWLEKWTDSTDPDKLQGVLLINNERRTPPSGRGEPLTKAAERFLNLYGCTYMTTLDLFKEVKEVKEGNNDAETAKENLFSRWRT